MSSKKKIFKPGPPQKRKKKKFAKRNGELSLFLSASSKMKDVQVLMENTEKEYYEKEIKLNHIRSAAHKLIKAGKPGESYNTYSPIINIYERDMKESLYKLNLMKCKYFHVHDQINFHLQPKE